VQGIDNGQRIPTKNAYCAPKGADKSAEGENISPKISWDKGPDGTKSYLLVVVDRDVPLDMSNNNKDDKKIPEAAARQNFYHWLLANIPYNITSIAEGAGKDAHYGDMLDNDYLKFSGVKIDPQSIKKFSGYDGPCPPWNDERMHNYHFKVYALSETFSIGDDPSIFSGDDIMHKISPYILAQGEVIGTYSLNPGLMPKAAATPAPTTTPAKN
jgi:hypothetical protein